MSNNRRRLQGRVVSNNMDKTIVVLVSSTKPHRLYRKVVRSSKKYMAHDENNEAKIGDVVQIVESRPISRHKRWALEKFITRADQSAAEITPSAVDEGVEGS